MATHCAVHLLSCCGQQPLDRGNTVGVKSCLEHAMCCLAKRYLQRLQAGISLPVQWGFASQLLSIPLLWQCFPYLKQVMCCWSSSHGHNICYDSVILHDEIWNSFVFLQRSQQECNTASLQKFLVPEAIRDYGAWLPLFHQYSLQHAHASVVGINTVSLSGVCE
jgi:hypothetical protein